MEYDDTLEMLEENVDKLLSLLLNQFGANIPCKWKILQVDDTVFDKSRLHRHTGVQRFATGIVQKKFSC